MGTLALAGIATWLSVALLWGHAISEDSDRRRGMLVTLGVLVVMSFGAFALASLLFSGGSEPSMVQHR